MDPSTKKRRTATELRPCHDASDTRSACASSVVEYDAVTMQLQLESFIRSEDVDSAQILGDFLVALALAPSDSKTHSCKSRCFDRQKRSYKQLLILIRSQTNWYEVTAADGGVHEALPSAFHANTLRLFADLMVVRREFKRAIVSSWPLDW